MLAAYYHLPAFFCMLQCDSILLAEPLFEVVMDSWNFTSFTFVFLYRSGIPKIRWMPSSRNTEVCTSVAAMPVKTYKLGPWNGAA